MLWDGTANCAVAITVNITLTKSVQTAQTFSVDLEFTTESRKLLLCVWVFFSFFLFFNYIFLFSILEDEDKVNSIYNSQVWLRSRGYEKGLLIREAWSLFHTSEEH